MVRLRPFFKPVNLFATAKYGSGVFLGLVDLYLIFVVLRDVERIGDLQLDYLTLLLRALGEPETVGLSSVYSYVVIVLVPLVLGTLWNFLVFRWFPALYRRLQMTSLGRGLGVLGHLLVSAAVVIHIEASTYIEKFAGLCGKLGDIAPCYTSDLQLFVAARNHVFFWVLLAMAGVALRDHLKRNELVREFNFWRLIGSAGEHRPAYGDEFIYANSASMAPTLASIQKMKEESLRRYQQAVPTSDEARRFLKQRAQEARRYLQRYLLGSRAESNGLEIEFFSGTSRALEAGLLRIGDLNHIIMSPYEHPSQNDVVSWISRTNAQFESSIITPEAASFFSQSWREQKNRMYDEIVRRIRTHERTALVISEVHHLTGMRIPVKEVIEELRDLTPTPVVFIVDASQAVGATSDPMVSYHHLLTGDDFVYFSAHKWLLSPNTCGVLVSHGQGGWTVPYDVFRQDALPTSTIDPNTVFGLAAALGFLFRDDLFGRLLDESLFSKALFLEMVKEERGTLDVVQTSSSELNVCPFVAVRPRPGFRWRLPLLQFWEVLRGAGIDLTVVPEAQPFFAAESITQEERERRYLLRISFPFFLMGRKSRRLYRILKGLAIPA